MTARKMKGRWYVDFWFAHSDGRKERIRKRSPVQTKRGAEEYERQVREELLAGTYGRKPAPTLGEFEARFIEWCRGQHQKPSTVRAKESILEHHIVPVLGNKRMDEIEESDVMAIKSKLVGAGNGPKTTNNVLSVLAKLLKIAEELGEIATVPIRIKLVKAPPPDMGFLEEDELDRLLSAARSIDSRAELAVLLGADAGLRAGEMVGLEWADVDLERRLLTVRRTVWKGQAVAPKSGRGRTVVMTQRLKTALVNLHRHSSGKVLWRDDGMPVTTRVLEGWVNRGLTGGDLDRTGVHLLRHTFCARLATRGAAPLAIQKAAGHSSPQSTERYLHLGPKGVESAVGLLEAPAGQQLGNGEGPK